MRGGQRQALMLMQGLRAAGHASELLARPHTPLSKAAHAANFPVEPARLQTLWQRARQADLVHVHDARAHTLAALVCRSFVVSRRVAFPVGRSRAARWKYHRALRFLAVSNFVAQELEQAGIPPSKIDLVYDGVEMKPHPPSRLPGGSLSVVALDSRDPQKGRDLVEAASALTNISVSFSSNLAQDLPGASLFLYISRSEGFGSAALLAMSLGVPVIASRVGGLPEIVCDGVSGLLVENDPRSLADAMLRMQADSALAERLGRNGRSRAEQHFTAHHMIEKTLESYTRALAQAK